jgi:hypothetical protein
MRLADKIAIISGAASGMGAATARMFAREGAKVVIGDVLEHEGRQVADAIGASARFEPLDVTKEESWAAIVTATTRHFGKLDASGGQASDLAPDACVATRTGASCGRSAAVKTRPAASGGTAIDLIRACAWGLRRKATSIVPGNLMSETNSPRPCRWRSSSRRSKEAPTPQASLAIGRFLCDKEIDVGYAARMLRSDNVKNSIIL